MGHVYTPEDFGAGRIPTASDYVSAMDTLRAGLKTLSDRGAIHGANLHGSNFHADGGIGSDIDVLVVTNTVEAEEMLRSLRASINDEFHVPVDMVPVNVGMAKRGFHTIDHFYGLYMRTFCQYGVVGQNPFLVIEPNDTWDKPVIDVQKRLQAQLTKLSKRRSNLSSEYDGQHCDHIEDLMRLPIYAAIDVLRVKRGNYPSKAGKPLSKRECCSLYADECPEMASVVGDLQTVLDARNRYRQFLQNGGEPSQYVAMLGELDGMYPAARNVIEANFECLLAHPKLY